MPSPLGHSLIGYAMSASKTRIEPARYQALAFIFFANLPDIDFLPGLLVGNVFQFHRGPTHSLAFPFLIAVVLAAVIRRPEQRALLVRAGFLGTLSHVVLDFFCASSPAAGVPLLWPLDATRFASPLQVFVPMAWGGGLSVMSWTNVVAAANEAVVLGGPVVMLRWLENRSIVPADAAAGAKLSESGLLPLSSERGV